MSEPLEAQNSQLSMFSVEDFPANRTPWLVDVADLPTSATCGPPTPVLFASYDPAGWWRKTSQGFSQVTLDGSLERFSETWPRAGMTRNGIAYLRPPSAPLTDAIGSGSLPTPTVGDSASARNSTATRYKIPPTGIHAGNTLTDYVTLWPTPTARDYRSESCSPAFDRARMAHSRGKTLPTMDDWPSASVKMNGLQSHGVNVVNGALNPTWVEWLMGYPLNWTSLGE